MNDFDLDRAINRLFERDSATILVTDSGLGGMSVFAEIADRMVREPIFTRAAMIYFNAWPEQHRGYNSLKDMAERVRVFDRALKGMQDYHPDLILIACNTLSVLFDRTEFSRRKAIPVVDIVGFGVDMVHRDLSANPERTALLLGTVTTIASDVHRSRLVAAGIAPERIIVLPCDQLATQIEKGPTSETVASMLDGFMEEAAARLAPNDRDVTVALLCTHFGYCRSLIRKKLQRRTGGQVTVLDPNRALAAFLFQVAGGARRAAATIDIRILSRIIWDPKKIDAMAGITEATSKDTAQALRRYEHIPNLFTF